MKKLTIFVFLGLLFTGLATAVDNDQKKVTQSSVVDVAKKGRQSLKEIKSVATEAHDAAKKAHEKATKLKNTVQNEKVKGHGDPAVVSALEKAENYASDLINKVTELMEKTYESLTHATKSHDIAKEKHQELKKQEPLVNVQAFSL